METKWEVWVPIERLRAAFNQKEIGWTGGENDRVGFERGQPRHRSSGNASTVCTKPREGRPTPRQGHTPPFLSHSVPEAANSSLAGQRSEKSQGITWPTQEIIWRSLMFKTLGSNKCKVRRKG